jgi:hypothetical protein
MLYPLLSDRDVEKVTGRARSTLQKDRVAGTGIPFVRLGRLVRYRATDVQAYLAALPICHSTSETVPHRGVPEVSLEIEACGEGDPRASLNRQSGGKARPAKRSRRSPAPTER